MKKNDLTYAIISIDDLNKIDFSQIYETSAQTIARSVDLTKFTIKWNKEPDFIENGDVIPIGQYDHAEMREIIKSKEWSGEEN